MFTIQKKWPLFKIRTSRIGSNLAVEFTDSVTELQPKDPHWCNVKSHERKLRALSNKGFQIEFNLRSNEKNGLPHSGGKIPFDFRLKLKGTFISINPMMRRARTCKL
jgi:hypothetical protein